MSPLKFIVLPSLVSLVGTVVLYYWLGMEYDDVGDVLALVAFASSVYGLTFKVWRDFLLGGTPIKIGDNEVIIVKSGKTINIEQEGKSGLSTAEVKSDALVDLPIKEHSATTKLLQDWNTLAESKKKEAANLWLRSRSVPKNEFSVDILDDEFKRWTRVTEALHEEQTDIYSQFSRREQQIPMLQEMLNRGNSFTKAEIESRLRLEEMLKNSERAFWRSTDVVKKCLNRLNSAKEASENLENAEDKPLYVEDLTRCEADHKIACEDRKVCKHHLKAAKLALHQFDTELIDSYINPADIEEIGLSEKGLKKEYGEAFVSERCDWKCLDFKRAILERYQNL